MHIYCIHPDLVEATWDSVEGFLADGIAEYDAEYNIAQLKSLLVSGTWRLFAAIDNDNKVHGASAVSFINYPNAYVAFICSIGGKMIVNKELVSQFKDLLKSYGADRIQGQVNEKNERLLKRVGFEHKSVVVEMRI